MALWRGFTGLRGYEQPMQRDLRELERHLRDLDSRVSTLVAGEAVTIKNIHQGQGSNTPTVLHASTHATKVDASTGTDPIDPYFFKWKSNHLWEPSGIALDEITLEIKRSSAGQIGDFFKISDKANIEALAIAADGLASFSAAPRGARVNMRPGAAPAGIEPDLLVSGDKPFIWFRGGDITEGDNAILAAVPERVTTNTFIDFRPAVNSVRVTTVANRLNGQKGMQQPATKGDLNVSASLDEQFWTGEDDIFQALFHSGAYTVLAVYKMVDDAENRHHLIGRGMNHTGQEGVRGPGETSAGFVRVDYDNGAQLANVGPSWNTTGLADSVMTIVVTRNSSDEHSIFADSNTGPSLIQARGDSGTTLAGEITFNGLMATDKNNSMPAGACLYELVVWKTELSEAEVLEVYQYAAIRYGRTQLGAGAVAGDILHIYDGNDVLKDVIDKDGRVGIGTDTPGSTGNAVLEISGADADILGPHFQTTTDLDIYPLLHFHSWAHDNIDISFDAYFAADSQWKSSDAGTNFQLRKNGDGIGFMYDSGVAQGDQVTWNFGWILRATGNMSIGTVVDTARLSVESATEQFRLGFSSGNHTKFTVESGGDLVLAPTEGDVRIDLGNFDDGHLKIGAAHIWFDGSTLFGKISAPSSATDGTNILGIANQEALMDFGTHEVAFS